MFCVALELLSLGFVPVFISSILNENLLSILFQNT